MVRVASSQELQKRLGIIRRLIMLVDQIIIQNKPEISKSREIKRDNHTSINNPFFMRIVICSSKGRSHWSFVIVIKLGG